MMILPKMTRRCHFATCCTIGPEFWAFAHESPIALTLAKVGPIMASHQRFQMDCQSDSPCCRWPTRRTTTNRTTRERCKLKLFDTTRGYLMCLAGAMALVGSNRPVVAQSPTITLTTPLALKPGQPSDLKLHGANLAGSTQLWTSFAGTNVLAPEVPNNGTNAAECVYKVTVPSDVPVGIYGVRVATANGASPLRLVVVDDLPSVAQAAGNNTTVGAQALTLPIAVDGQVGSLSQHYFKFTVAAGQLVTMDVLARRIGSALDPMIRLLDAKGRELAYSDDVPGLRSDCRLCYQFKDAGEYMLELRDIRFQGSGNHFFRLRIGDFPCVTVPYPLAAKKGTAATVNFAGLNLDGVPPAAVTTAMTLASA